MGRDAAIVVVGGGLVGCATARALARRGHAVTVLEAESDLARHQSGRNSGVIHSGLYYRPGSLRARFSVAGRDLLYGYLQEKRLPHVRCGKLVVAVDEGEIPRLDELERRGRANGLADLRRLSAGEIRHLEPAVAGVAGLLVAETGLVDFAAVNRSYADDIRAAGGEVRLSTRFLGARADGAGVVVRTGAGDLPAAALINCAGLQADRVARACGAPVDLRIVPFRGEYHDLAPSRRGLVSRPIYPVPDPAFPFLGVHLTPKLDGRIEAGPNAVLALRREGYGRASFRLADAASALAWPGLWRLMARHGRMGLGELWRSWSKAAFVRALRRLVPAITPADLVPGGCGVRAQAMRRDGTLVDDFHIVRHGRTLHALNVPSPAATASLAIGEHLADEVERALA